MAAHVADCEQANGAKCSHEMVIHRVTVGECVQPCARQGMKIGAPTQHRRIQLSEWVDISRFQGRRLKILHEEGDGHGCMCTRRQQVQGARNAGET